MTEGFGFMPVPEELANRIKEHQEYHRMHSQDKIHAVNAFMLDLSHEQLEVLDLIIASSESDEVRPYLRGQIATMQHLKFDSCPCGESHNPEDLLPPEGHDATQGSITEYLDNCQKYNVAPTGEDEDGPVACLDCGHVFPNLADRMRRAPGAEGCQICIDKTKWG